MILYLQHIRIEGPDTLGDFFSAQGFATRTAELFAGDRLPVYLDEFDAVVCLGGPMNVDEEDKFPFIAEEIRFIQKILKERIPFLGLCLGSQLLAKASGASVEKEAHKEVGFYGADLTRAGIEDPMFRNMPESFNVFHWHEDMWNLPEDGQLLVTSSGCPNQAFRVNDNAYGLQFHVEVNDRSIVSWVNEYIMDKSRCEDMKIAMLKAYKNCRRDFDANALAMYNNFLSVIKDRSRIDVREETRI